MNRILIAILFTLVFRTCSASFTYDQSGNLTSDGVYTYVYNEASRLKEVQVGSTGIVKAKYFYDHQGQRIKKIEDGQICYYTGNHHRSCGDESETFHFVENQRVATVSGNGGTEFSHNGHLGSPFAILDENGSVISRLEYEPYGEPSVIPNESLQGRYSFSGKELSNTNSYYFEARYLSSSFGQFNRPDPVSPIVGNSFSLNPYQYANNNPLSYQDSDGELPIIPIAIFLAREYAAYKLSEATGGVSDLLSVRRLGIRILKKSSAFSFKKKHPKETNIHLARQRLKELPAPRKIEATWSVSRYKHGGFMTAIEHVIYRHSYNSGFISTSKFAKGASAREIRSLVDSALRYGNVSKTGKKSFTIEYNFGRTIGTDSSGDAASNIRVHIRDGDIKTAFPF